LLRRVFFIDALKCPRCASAMAVLALISDPPVVTKILRHLRLPTRPPPLAPARGSTTTQAWILDPPRHADPDDPAGEALDLIPRPPPHDPSAAHRRRTGTRLQGQIADPTSYAPPSSAEPA
jgi:hypothetical protein